MFVIAREDGTVWNYRRGKFQFGPVPRVHTYFRKRDANNALTRVESLQGTLGGPLQVLTIEELETT